MEWVLATQNQNKVKEIKAALPPDWTVRTAVEAGILEELPETGATLEENAIQKATYLQTCVGGMALSDDSGLEILALNGAPGVYSARYAGPQKDDHDNRLKVLEELAEVQDRRARFKTVLAWATPDGVRTFEGEVWGQILHEERGQGGFGYDALFVPDEGDGRTFAEMSLDEKKALSHRSRALAKWRLALGI
ncbi:MAG TPA: non-canonical purine NTP pyrophosphatase, RdgB/HAM1 family [Cryomorphaceae bacterium]|nr:non-canonical purine NTP pyrophosphatase, RdgB/HAM1 family [Cryomorphaceae bacterium]